MEQPRMEQPRMEQPRMEQPRMEQPRTEPPRIDSRIRADPRINPRADLRDSEVDPRADPPRADLRVGLRVDPEGDPRDPRFFPRTESRDVRIDPREIDPRETWEFRGDPDSGLARPRDPRNLYGEDEMDIDPPTSGRLTSYFLPGEGISREVIQADICRYLGADATCWPDRDRKVNWSKTLLSCRCLMLT